ncbi:hypothetical protein [Roseateles sp.]|uniref:hypothetical protein n=1 Tax=Roseateles sp. TaxID=1971397 RepID=UPI003264E68C
MPVRDPVPVRARTEPVTRNDLAAQVQQLEQALSTYFDNSTLGARQLPAPDVVFARHYIGKVRNGRKVIYGKFYPIGRYKGDDAGLVISTDDGNLLWDLQFDVQDGQIVRFYVGGR